MQHRSSAVMVKFLLLTACSLLPALTLAADDVLEQKLLLASPNTIQANAELNTLMNTLAEKAITDHCTACHGENLEGSIGIPNLVDYDWLWGITGMESTSVEPVMEIMQTILYGIRNTNCPEDTKRYGACPDTRFSEMPAYRELELSDQELSDITEYVIDLSGGSANAEAVTRAAPTWKACTECHAEDGYGYKTYGGPDLTDAVWLYGGTREQILDVITNGRKGVCPPWADTLDAVTIKALAVYLFNKANGL